MKNITVGGKTTDETRCTGVQPNRVIEELI